jgi:hypothetical protein
MASGNVTSGTVLLREENAANEKLTFPDIRIVSRGEKDGVKGHDRVAAASPPLTPPAPRLCSVYRGMSVAFVQQKIALGV